MRRAKLTASLSAFAMLSLFSGSAIAGEVTGRGDQIDAPGASICKFSGLNDGEDPPGRTQSFGQNVRNGYPLADPVDPTSLDPDGGFQLHPGWFCNATNVDPPEEG